jgi:hypothetical protein
MPGVGPASGTPPVEPLDMAPLEPLDMVPLDIAPLDPPELIEPLDPMPLDPMPLEPFVSAESVLPQAITMPRVETAPNAWSEKRFMLPE